MSFRRPSSEEQLADPLAAPFPRPLIDASASGPQHCRGDRRACQSLLSFWRSMLCSCGCSSSGHWSFGLHSSRRHRHVGLRSSSYPRVHGSFGALFGRCGSASHPRFKPSVQAISGSCDFRPGCSGFPFAGNFSSRWDDITLFGRYRGVEGMPSVCSLLELMNQFLSAGEGENRLEGYVTAQEGDVGDDPAETEAGARSLVHQLSEQLLTQSEEDVKTVRIGVSTWKVGGSPATSTFCSTSFKYLQILNCLLGIQVYSGPVPAATHRRLKELACIGPGRLGDLHQAPNDPSTATLAGGITEDDEEDIDGVPLDPEEEGTGDPLLRKLLSSQTAILQKLASTKLAQSDRLSLLGGPRDAEEGTRSSSGVKGIAPRQLLVDQFRRNPDSIVSVFRERLSLAGRKSSVKELEPRDLWFHLQEAVRFGSHKTFDLCGIHGSSYVRSNGKAGHQPGEDAGVSLSRASSLRRGSTMNGPPTDLPGGSTFCADGAASKHACRICPRPAVRSSLGGNWIGLYTPHFSLYTPHSAFYTLNFALHTPLPLIAGAAENCNITFFEGKGWKM